MHGYVTDEEEEGLPEPTEITLQRVHSLIRQAHEKRLGRSQAQEVWKPPLLQAERQPTKDGAEAAAWQGMPFQSVPKAVTIHLERMLPCEIPIQASPAVPVQVNMHQIPGLQAAPQADPLQTATEAVPMQFGVLQPPAAQASIQTTLAQAAAKQSLVKHFGAELMLQPALQTMQATWQPTSKALLASAVPPTSQCPLPRASSRPCSCASCALPPSGYTADHPGSGSTGAAEDTDHDCNPCVLATSRHGCCRGDSCRFCHSTTAYS